MNYKLRQFAREKAKDAAILAACTAAGLALIAGVIVLPYIVKKQ